jgi:hypothetical protein
LGDHTVWFRSVDLIGIFSEPCPSHSFFGHVLSTTISALSGIRWFEGIGKFVWSRDFTAFSTARCLWLAHRFFSEPYARKLPVPVRSLWLESGQKRQKKWSGSEMSE